MFQQAQKYSAITAVLPTTRAKQVVQELTKDTGHALVWQGRGTLLHDRWWQRWVPPISPTKTLIRMLVPDTEVSKVIDQIVETGKLHQQATGAVFSTPCDHAFVGADFAGWPTSGNAADNSVQHNLNDNLHAIYCLVSSRFSDHISRAAINAGAHGPVVYYSEGRGLRDRLGWLRITKEHDQEVLMVICDDSNMESVFEAMAKAGELHLPGHGLMYRLNIDQGMFNLPSRISHSHYQANMQQIIHAIDHLNGHSHWRDQSVFDVGGEGRGVGVDHFKTKKILDDRVCISAMIRRSDTKAVMDMMLNSGAPGLNLNYARFAAHESIVQIADASIQEEYAMLRSITKRSIATQICQSIEQSAHKHGVTDLCVFVNEVPAVATYVPGEKDYRVAAKTAEPA